MSIYDFIAHLDKGRRQPEFIHATIRLLVPTYVGTNCAKCRNEEVSASTSKRLWK